MEHRQLRLGSRFPMRTQAHNGKGSDYYDDFCAVKQHVITSIGLDGRRSQLLLIPIVRVSTLYKIVQVDVSASW
jgi:hypothetical protein